MKTRTCARGLATIAALAALAGVAKADENAIKLKPANGMEVVQQNCITCHSLDYVEMNSPFLDEKGWTAEVTKMVKTFGAAVDEADQKRIIEYLTANYGKS